MNAIITGAGGQDGHYLTALLKSQDVEIIGVSRSEDFLHINLADYAQVRELIRQNQPGYVFHLAAISTTRHSAGKENHDTISTGTINILEAVREYSPLTKVFLAGSGLQFENKNEPIKETDNFEARNMYAVSRIHSAYAGRYYRSLGLKVYIGYLFNHDSPLRTSNHINSKVVDAVKRIAGGSREKLSIGDLSVQKEFGFAGDIVRGMMTLVDQETHWEATIGTGRAYSIQEWVSYCFSMHKLNWEDHVVENNDFKSEYKILVSDPATIFSLGWKPRIPLEELAKMMMR
jgi:GDPmannose 4,6-dehydratase